MSSTTETGSARHTNSEYPWKTACSTSRRYGDNSIPPAQPLSLGAMRQQAGFWRWMPDVVCQLVGIGMVPWYVMKLAVGVSVVPHGEKFHEHAKAPFLGHSPPGSEGPMPILVSASSSATVGAGACLVWGSTSDRLWNRAGADQVLQPKWKHTYIASVLILWVL